MNEFKLVSEYEPAGDQPQAIDRLSVGVLRGDKAQVLLGVLNVKLSLPLPVAVLHNGGAALLLFVLVSLLARLRSPD